MPRFVQPVFIGPVCVGKTTVSTLVADALDLRRVELDEVAMPYYRESPEFIPDEYNRLLDDEGFLAAYRYWEPALAFAVERVIQDDSDAVLDLGAGHTCYLNRTHFARVARCLRFFSNVVLLLPDHNPQRSVEVIRDRCRRNRDGMTWEFEEIDFIHHWVTSDQNFRLADHVVFTAEDTPEVVAERVIELVS